MADTLASVTATLASMQAEMAAQRDMIQTGLARRQHGGIPAGAAPYARTGENIMGSRGFSYGKTLAYFGKGMAADECKIELDLCQRFTSSMRKAGYRLDKADNLLVPFWPEGFSSDHVDNDLFLETKALIHAGTSQSDADEFAWLKKRYGQKTAVAPAQSWIDQSVGGAWVGPATFGSPIELLRNMETILAVADIVPLGPTGQITFPRMTKATQGGWLGENTAQTPTQAGTSALTLRAKKAFVIVVLPGELLRYGSPAAESMIRNDIFKSCSLIVDQGFLTGPGSDNVPLGVVTGATASGNPYGFATVSLTNANTLSPQDPLKFIAAVEGNNGVFSGWIMHPVMFFNLLETRATTYSGSGQVGQFVNDTFRAMADGYRKMLNGYRVLTSAQVSLTRGTGSQTFAIGAQLEDFVAGLFGAIELSQTDQGWTLFSADQVAVRGIMSADGAARHPGVWAVADALNTTPGA